jgi:hypothetical protein
MPSAPFGLTPPVTECLEALLPARTDARLYVQQFWPLQKLPKVAGQDAQRPTNSGADNPEPNLAVEVFRSVAVPGSDGAVRRRGDPTATAHDADRARSGPR